MNQNMESVSAGGHVPTAETPTGRSDIKSCARSSATSAQFDDGFCQKGIQRGKCAEPAQQVEVLSSLKQDGAAGLRHLVCIVCPRGCRLTVDETQDYKVTGNGCPRGAEYGRTELQNPTRTLTTTVCVAGGLHRRLPVRTSKAIPKALLPAAMAEAAKVRLTAPVAAGQVLIHDLLGTGADLVATRALPKAEP